MLGGVETKNQPPFFCWGLCGCLSTQRVKPRSIKSLLAFHLYGCSRGGGGDVVLNEKCQMDWSERRFLGHCGLSTAASEQNF